MGEDYTCLLKYVQSLEEYINNDTAYNSSFYKNSGTVPSKYDYLKIFFPNDYEEIVSYIYNQHNKFRSRFDKLINEFLLYNSIYNNKNEIEIRDYLEKNNIKFTIKKSIDVKQLINFLEKELNNASS